VISRDQSYCSFKMEDISVQNHMRKYTRDGRSPLPNSDAVSRVMSANKGKDTLPELELRRALREIGQSGYRIHKKGIPGRPDIAFVGQRVAVFVNGCFWHRCPYCNPSAPKTHADFWTEKFQKNIERDALKCQALRENGWKVLIFWECEIKKDSLAVARKISRAIHE